jgi:hypothetical protein
VWWERLRLFFFDSRLLGVVFVSSVTIFKPSLYSARRAYLLSQLSFPFAPREVVARSVIVVSIERVQSNGAVLFSLALRARAQHRPFPGRIAGPFRVPECTQSLSLPAHSSKAQSSPTLFCRGLAAGTPKSRQAGGNAHPAIQVNSIQGPRSHDVRLLLNCRFKLASNERWV